jgi:hypothetical protein
MIPAVADQRTAVSLEFCTTAVNCSVPPELTLALLGDKTMRGEDCGFPDVAGATACTLLHAVSAARNASGIAPDKNLTDTDLSVILCARRSFRSDIDFYPRGEVGGLITFESLNVTLRGGVGSGQITKGLALAGHGSA